MSRMQRVAGVILAMTLVSWTATDAQDQHDLTIASKPGQCPPVPMLLHRVLCRAVEECSCDAECEGNLKCCFDGCSRTCKKPVVECPVRLCKMFCPYGFEHDKNNCQLCSCFDPCTDFSCPDGTVCKPQLMPCLVPPCIPPSIATCVPVTTTCTESALLSCRAMISTLNNFMNHSNAWTEVCIIASEHQSCVDAISCTESDNELYQLYLRSLGSADVFLVLCRNDTLSVLVANDQQCPFGAIFGPWSVCFFSSFPDRFYDDPIDEICQYYRSFHSCIGDWLHSQHSCGSAVPYIMEATRRSAVPFTSRYDCPIVSNKPGQCPRVDGYGICVQLCSNDGDCKDDLKCCSNGCGHSCQKPVKKCPELPCDVYCPYGFVYDENDCPTCDCFNPCDTHQCAPDEICKPQLVLCFRAPCTPNPPSVATCVPKTKPGRCPQVPQSLTGVACKPIDECTYDAHCDSNLKCCSNGCRLTCQKPVQCPVQHCEIFCMYGFVYDDNNCPLCECFNPCASIMCPDGTVCQPLKLNCSVPPCVPPAIGVCVASKPGQCPPVHRVGKCMESCSNDNDCKGDLKCCSNGCGHTCQKPVAECPMIRCACNCERSGFKRDKKGCQTCECNDLCECHQCETHEKCVVKPGRCSGQGRRRRCRSATAVCVNKCKKQTPCGLRCAWGLKYDRNGCQLCECQENPCNLVDCASGKVCVPVLADCPADAPCKQPYVAHCVDAERMTED